MDLGSLFATFGVDSSQLQRLSGELNTVDRQAASTFNNMGNHASSAMGHMAGLVGITLSMVGAFALAEKAVSFWYSSLSGGINKVEEFKKGLISTSYLLAAQSDVKPPDLGRAYAEWGNYYKWMKEQAIMADKEAASGMEDIMAVSEQLLKKGVKAETPEQFKVIARLTDVMKGAVPAYASLAMQARGEVEAILSGITRMGSQTSMILSGIDPEFKKNIANARATRTELEYFNKLLPKIEQYTKDMMGTLDAVTSSMKAAWSVIQVKAFGDAHRDIVGFIGELGNKLVENGKLTAQGEAAALAFGLAWAKSKVAISAGIDYLLANLPNIVDKMGMVVSGTASFVGWSVNAAVSITQWTSKNYELVKTLGEFYLITKITTWILELTVAIKASVAASTIWIGITQGLIPILTGAATQTTFYTSGMYNAAAGTMTWAGTVQYATVAGRALNAMMLTLLPNIIAAASALAAYGAYKTFTEPGQLTGPTASGDPFADIVGGAREKDLIAARKMEFIGPPQPSEVEMEVRRQQENIGKILSGNAPPTPALRPPVPKETKGAGGANAQEAAEKSIRSFIETMTQATAQGAGDTEAVLAAWKSKQLQTLSELAAKGADITQAKAALDQAYDSKRRKLDSDFSDWYTAQMGNQLGVLRAAENKKLTEVAGNEAKAAQVRQAYALKYAILQNEQETQRLTLAKGYLDQFSQLIPGLDQQVRYKRMALDIEKQQADLQLNRLYLENKITAEVLDQSRAAQAFVNQLKEYQLRQQQLSMGGVGAGLTLWGNQRNIESQTSTTQAVISTMKDAEAGISGALSSTMINAMKGVKTNWEDFFSSVAETGIKKGMDYVTGQLFDSLGKLFGDTALNLVNPLVYSSQTASQALQVGGYNAGVAIVNAAIAASEILGTGSGGGGGGFGGFLSGIFGSGGETGLGTGVPGTGAGVYEDLAGILSVPAYADGGIVTRPTLAIVGERGPEKITPLGSDKPTLNVIIYPAPNTEAKTEKQPNGDLIVTFDQIGAAAYNRRGSLYKAINSGGGATKR